MTISKLPGRIAAVMAGTVVVLVLTVAVSVAWMTRAMDDQSRRNAAERIRATLPDVLEDIRSTTLNRAKWDEAARRVAARDAVWIAENVGWTAVVGDVAQLVIVWGGPFAADMGWTDRGGRAPRSGVLDPAVIGLAEAGISPLPLDSYRGVAFFAWRDGEVYALSASRIEPMVGSGAPVAADRDLGRLLLGRRLDDELVRGLGNSALLDGLEIVRFKPGDRPSLPLMGGQGTPVAHLAWNPQLAGTALVQRMLPLLALVTTLAAGLVLTAMLLTRRQASAVVRAGEQALVAARTDALTGLPNRLAFTEALARPARAGERAILVLDVNGFKRINDSIGHAAGDEVIRLLAERLGRLAQFDCLLARIGGDEFVFVVTTRQAEARTLWLAGEIGRATLDPFEVQGHALRLRAAMGYAVQPGDATTGSDLVRRADLAMYEAKRQGGGVVAFNAVVDRADRDARAIEAELRAMLARPATAAGGLAVAYQPIVDLATGRLARAEALARWTSPALGPVPPDRFIAVAEQSGIIGELGRRIVGLVCDDLQAWPDLRVSLNVSAHQLLAPAFVPDLVAELARRGIAPSRIEVELTETVVVDDPRLAAARLEELHEAGFSTALDDFGTGYSSIGYLQQLAFGSIKIDRSFVTGLCASSERLTLCNAMILLGQALGLAIVCEGVETAEEHDMIAVLGCGLAQGYHFDRPIPIDRLAARWLGPEEARAAVA